MRRWGVRALASVLTFALFVAASAPTASAKPKPKKKDLVTVSITAVVEFVDQDFPGVLCANLVEGDTITGSYTYDSSVPDTNAPDWVGDYENAASPSGITLDLNGAVARTDPNNVRFLLEVVNDYPGDGSDSYVLHSYNNLPLSCGSPVEHISWQLDDPTGTALSSDALPTQPPVLAAFQSFFGLDIRGQDDLGNRYFVRAHVTSAVLVPRK